MTAVAFDTYQFVKELTAADFTEKQAEAVVRAFQEAHNSAGLATRQDIREMELRLEARLDTRLTEINIRLAELKAEIIKWVTGALLAQAALITALVKLL